MFGRDQNLIPVNAAGSAVPLPITSAALPVYFARGRPADFDGGFLQADWLVYPWMMVIMRYDSVNSSADYLNGLANLQSAANFYNPAHVTRNRYTPGVQFLIHANIKASFEYQIRPQQQIASGINPLTGATAILAPFRVNTAVAGLEFVY